MLLYGIVMHRAIGTDLKCQGLGVNSVRLRVLSIKH